MDIILLNIAQTHGSGFLFSNEIIDRIDDRKSGHLVMRNVVVCVVCVCVYVGECVCVCVCVRYPYQNVLFQQW